MLIAASRIVASFLTLGLAFSLTGCIGFHRMYTGPRLPAEERVLIYNVTWRSLYTLFIVRHPSFAVATIDGVRAKTWADERSIETTPGPHSLEITYDNYDGVSRTYSTSNIPIHFV